MILNIRKHSSDNIEFNKILNKKLLNLRKPYTDWIDNLSKKSSDNLDWWILNVATRDLNCSDLYSFICILDSLKDFLGKEKVSLVTVDSIYLKNTIAKRFDNKIKVKLNRKFSFVSILKKKLSFIHVIVFHLIVFTLSNRKKINKKGSIFYDTFLNSKLDKSRYYSAIIKKILKNKNSYLIPSFHSQEKIYSTLPKLINSRKSKNILLKEGFLSIKDLLYSFLIVIRKRNFLKKKVVFKDFDLTEIYNSEILNNNSFSSQIIAQNNYFFFKQLSKEKINIKKMINLFENQIIDKGWNLGVNKFHSKTKTYGYQNFSNFSQYMHYNPSKIEASSGVIPKKILVIGNSYIKLRKEFCKNLNIDVAPAINHQYLYKNLNSNSKKKNYFITIILSGFLIDDMKLIDWCLKSNIHNHFEKIYLKTHAILSQRKIRTIFSKLPKNYFFINLDFIKTINSSKFLISAGGTSAIYEMILLKKKLIIPEINPYDRKNVIDLNLNLGNVKFVRDPKLLKNLINENIFKSKNSVKLNNYFKKIDAKNINIFF